MFMGLISCLGHKEWRFIVYVVPIFNVAAARGAEWIALRRKNNLMSRILLLAPLAPIIANSFATILLTNASMANYPGGQALTIFHQSLHHTPPHIHISNLAAQSGASLFLQLHSSPHYHHQPLSNTQDEWRYNKTENLTIPTLCSSSSTIITHLISEIPPSKDPLLDEHWYTVEVIKGFDRWTIDWDVLTEKSDAASADLSGKLKVMEMLRLVKTDKLWILARKNNRHQQLLS